MKPIVRCQNKQSGFAIVIALSILSFTLLLLLAITAFVRVEQGVSTGVINQLTARQNALLGLQIAIGELQKYTGPDQRVTAAADIAAAADGPRLTAGNPALNTTSVNGTANGLSVNGEPSVQTGTRWWTGVWGRAGTNYSIPANSVYEETPSPVLLNWLVSGNENGDFGIDSDGWVAGNNASTFTPGDAVDWSGAGLDPANPASWTASSNYANIEIQSSGQKAVLLVGPRTAGFDPVNGESASERYVVAPMKDVGIDTSGNNPKGRYAWWIGDEGVKASYAISDPYPGENNPDANTTSGAQSRLRLMSATRSGIELLPGWQDYPDANDSSASVQFERVNELGQAQMITPSLTSENRGSSFHDVTLFSRGLLTDTLNGGLRTDLTYYFESSGNWNSSPLKGEGIIPAAYSPNWGSGGLAPKWDWLYSFYNTNPSVTSPSLTIRPETATEVGIYPVMTQLRMIYFTEDARITNPKSLPEDEIFNLPMRCNVAIVLANPYNVALEVPANDLEFLIKNNSTSSTGIVIRAAMGAGKGTDLATFGILRTAANTTQSTGLLDTVKFTVPSSFSIPPGKTVTLAVDGNSQVLVGSNDPDAEPVNSVGLSVRTGSNPIVSSDYFSAADTLDFTTPVTPTGAGIALYQYDSDLSLTMRQNGGDNYQRIEHFRILKGTNQANSFSGIVLGSAHLKFIAPAQRTMDWTTPNTLKSIFSYYVYSRPYQDFNIRAGTITHPNVNGNGNDGTYVLNSPPSYGAGVIYSAAGGNAGGDIFAAFTDSLHPAQWAEDFNDDLRQASLSGVLYDFPRRDASQPPVISLAQLQHANIATNDEALNGTINFETGYVIANSYHNPFVTRDQSVETRQNRYTLATGGTSGSTRYFDLSYLLNTALWDSYFFSGVLQTGPDFRPLNSRYQLQDGAADSDARSNHSAASLTTKGAFNVNSTSKEAWAAILGGLNGLRVNDDNTDSGIPFPRTLWQPENNVNTGGSFQTAGSGDEAYAGYRRLTPTEIDLLAEEIVKRVRARGPFVSLAQFINRTLVSASDDFNAEINDADGDGYLAASPVPQGRGLSGPLQAAIDSTASGINSFANVSGTQVVADAADEYGDRVLFNGEIANSLSHKSDSNNNRVAYFSDKTFDAPHTVWEMDQSAEPGPNGRTTTASAAWLMQGDVLQAVGSALSARSDTFIIRTYGEAVNAINPNRRLSGVWCEAVVRRSIDYIDSDSNTAEDLPSDLTALNKKFGRGYQVVSFRWLAPEDI